MSLLSVKGLSVSFGGVQALRNVSFEVEAACFVGLMGPNGAGKTTAINCISGIYTPQEGRVQFDGNDLMSMEGDQVASLGISRTFQDLNFLNLVSEMSILEYLKIGQFALSKNQLLFDAFHTPRSKAEDLRLKKRAYRILEFFREVRDEFEPPEESRNYPILYGRGGFPDLIDVEKSPLGILSFAWRRRLDLARALVSGPKLLLLDEPAQGLAPSEMQNLGKLLKRIQSEFNVAAVIVEHNVQLITAISDRIVAMHHGEVFAEGTPSEILANQDVIEVYLGKQEEVATAEVSLKLVETEKEEKEEKGIPLIEAKSLDVFYGQAQALSRVSVKLYPNQIASVLGTNGSGKSTLLRAISGIEKPVSGDILVKGDYLPLGWPERAVECGIQYVPQGHAIFPRLTVAENLKVGAYSYERRGIKADLDRVFFYFPALKDLRHVPAGSLSGGLQQMLAIGQAIIGHPEVLLVDEPSLGLAPILVKGLFEVIKKISVEEKCSVLLVEQSINLCLEISDYIFMMSAGMVIGEGESRRFKDDPSIIQKSLGFI